MALARNLLTVLWPLVLLWSCAVPREVALSASDRQTLLEKAEAWGVPQPERDSQLVKIGVYRSGDVQFYALGFVDPSARNRALVGFSMWPTDKGLDTEMVEDGARLSLADIAPTSPFNEVQGTNLGLITGIQLIRAGQDKLGAALIEKAIGEDAGHHRSPFRVPGGENPVTVLARSCLAHAINQITTPEPDFAQIKASIETILADEPELRSEATDWALERLGETLAYQPAEAGTIERLIDDYLMSGGRDGAMSISSGETSEAERALIVKGFEAIPSIMKQRRSKRLTNHLMQGFNNFSSYPMDAGQVLSAYLQRFANDEFGSNWLDRQKGYTPEDDAVARWWKGASALGEEEYVKMHTFVRKGDKNSLSRELLVLAQVRYPQHLQGIYRTVLKTGDISWPVADAIAAAEALPSGAKIALFKAAVATNKQSHRNSALMQLIKLDAALGDGMLRGLLEAAPSVPEREYWLDMDAALGRFVAKSSDPEVWAALDALLQRADLGLRMELIDDLYPPRDAAPEILDSYHEIYLRFRDDETIRNEKSSEKLSGPGAGFPHERLAMRDFMHMHWARWLKLEIDEPERGASAAKWKAFRERVSEAVAENREAERERSAGAEREPRTSQPTP